MLEQLIIIGSSGLGKEVASQATADGGLGRDWILYGFVDSSRDKGDVVSGFEYMKILGNPKEYIPHTQESFIPAIGNPILKAEFVTPLIDKGANFINLMTNTSLTPTTKYGKGILFGIETRISDNSYIGNYVYIGARTQIAHDVKVGDFSHIGANCFIAGNVEIGELVEIHPCSCIASGVKIGPRAVIGMGSVVLRDVNADTKVIGNPAKRIN